MWVLCSCPHVPAGRRKWCKPAEEDPDSHLFSRDGWLLPLCYEKGGVLATNELVSPWGFQCCLICLLERSVLCLPDLPSQSDLKKKKWHANVFFFFSPNKPKNKERIPWYHVFSGHNLLWFKKERNSHEAMTWCRREDWADERKSRRLYFDGGIYVKLEGDLVWRKTLGGQEKTVQSTEHYKEMETLIPKVPRGAAVLITGQ